MLGYIKMLQMNFIMIYIIHKILISFKVFSVFFKTYNDEKFKA